MLPAYISMNDFPTMDMLKGQCNLLDERCGVLLEDGCVIASEDFQQRATLAKLGHNCKPSIASSEHPKYLENILMLVMRQDSSFIFVLVATVLEDLHSNSHTSKGPSKDDRMCAGSHPVLANLDRIWRELWNREVLGASLIKGYYITNLAFSNVNCLPLWRPC